MNDLCAECPQCGWNTFDCGGDADLSNVNFNCDDCGAEFTASFDVIFDTATLITRGTAHDEEEIKDEGI